jgi:murein DD-endopeptidase MepM/ murein hydrolase activator NlpD
LAFVVVGAMLLAPVCARALPRATATDRAGSGRSVVHLITPSDTFASLLAGEGIASDEIARWRRAARPLVDLARLVAGRALRLELDARGRLAAMRYDLDGEDRLAIDRGNAGRLKVRREPQPVRVRSVGARGVVGRNFPDAAMRAGIPDAVTSQLVDLLSWRLDFKADLHRGDRFQVLWEQRTTLDGRPLRPGRVLAVEYAGRADSASAYWIEPEDGAEGVYVDDQGRQLDGAPLRFPLEFTRISSAFSEARFHPILATNRPHHGVDFAAPAGTPVRAIGRGAVRFAGVKNGFGTYIELDHGDEFVSAYAHLQGIAPGVANGARIARGQLLGWVGQTGLATGPHLHFAIFEGGEYVDPLSIQYPPQLAAAVSSDVFARARRQLQARLRAIPGSPAAPTAPETGVSPLALAGRVGPITLTF